MVLITIVTGAYNPTYNWGASHCSYDHSFIILTSWESRTWHFEILISLIGFKHCLFSIMYGIILPIDFHMFQRGWNLKPPTRSWWSYFSIIIAVFDPGTIVLHRFASPVDLLRVWTHPLLYNSVAHLKPEKSQLSIGKSIKSSIDRLFQSIVPKFSIWDYMTSYDQVIDSQTIINESHL